jgi:hypothetical protein
MPRKKAPDIFDDPEDFAAAFLYTIGDSASPRAALTRSLLEELARGCTTWDEFLARVHKAREEGETEGEGRGQHEDRDRLATLNYLEETAKQLKIEEDEDNRR